MAKTLVLVLRLIGAGALGVTALTLRAHACSVPENNLGVGVLAPWQRDLPPIPRNVAFVAAGAEPSGALPTMPVAVAVDAMGQPIMGRAVKGIKNRPGAFVAKLDEPLAPNFQIQSGGSQWITGDYLDEVPPEMPRITASEVHHYDEDQGGCGSGAVSSCDGMTNLNVTLAGPAKDDRAPVGGVTYAIYLEKSADAARTTPAPFALVSESGTISATTLFLSLDASWADSDAFVSVSAVDWAANESPRSEPYPANSNGSGCTVSLPRRHRPTVAVTFAMLAALAWGRRIGRRR
jgi:hypothetical protein